MISFNYENKRQDIYQSLIDKLSKKAFDSLSIDGVSLIDPIEGGVWDGSVIYVIGELKRVQKIHLEKFHNKDLYKLANAILKKWKTQSEIDSCFMGIGLSAWGELNSSHPLYAPLNTNEKESLINQIKVTREFKTNWEAFNSCIEGANCIIQPEQKNTLPIHLGKILEKFSETGYHDDSDGLGVYDSYGLMSLNYCVKALELLDSKNEIKQNYLQLFKPHCIRYAELTKDLIYPDGSGWSFGRSVGVLGQMQYIIFLEQCLFHEFIEGNLANWARGAIKKCLIKMIDLFWDEEKQWFCFRDENHTCYSYRNTFPMHWDLLRYFLQAFEYAKNDASKPHIKSLEFIPEKKCKEIITNPNRKTGVFIWSDAKVQFVTPIIGSTMGKLASDTAAKPHCRGLIEGVTEFLKPIWVPAFTIDAKIYYPTNRFLSSSVSREKEWDVYTVIFDRLYHGPKEETGIANIQVTTQYCFANNKFKRIDTVLAKEDIIIDELHMEVLQAAAHPKREIGYGKVYQILPTLTTDFPNVSISNKLAIGNDPTYRNFFGKPSHKWLISGTNINLKKDQECKLAVEISWE
jgi:hypothetical protein